MRPRISQQEAVYLVEVLTAQTNELREKLELVEMLRSEFVRSKLELHNLYRGTYEMVAAVECCKQVKAELQKVELQHYSFSSLLSTNERLIAKYSAIANGEPHDGRYKRLRVPPFCFPKEGRVLQVLAH